MNGAQTVANLITSWKAAGHTRAELVWLIAEACIGWPYVWGSLGEECTESKRRAYMGRDVCPSGDKELIRKRCQILNGSAGSCGGCKYYPGGARTRIFDCRGFTRWVLAQAGCGTLTGSGATSQWNAAGNWSEKGLIQDLPAGAVACVFKQVGTTMEHTGLAFGGQIIHCSVEVKRGKTTDKGWTHYAIPKALGGEPMADTKPTLRRGSKGEYVTLLQTKLIQRGYDLGKWGADGSFGAATEAAVKAFQKDAGLSADGVVGTATWDALESGKTTLYTVTVQHLSRSVAEGIIGTYGGVMTAEGGE